MKTQTSEKSFEYWTRKELEQLPIRKWDEDIGEFKSLIILPTRRIHNSGFRCMDFVAIKNDIPFCRLSGCSDVVHIEGIGGYGHIRQAIPKLIPPVGWSIDCLKTSGLLRIFCDNTLRAGQALSSFEIFSTQKH